MKNLFLLVILGVFALDVFGDEIPTLDLSEGHSYSLIARGGISFHPKTSFVLDTNLQVKLGSNRVFTISSEQNPWAIIYCPAGKTNIELVSLSGAF